METNAALYLVLGVYFFILPLFSLRKGSRLRFGEEADRPSAIIHFRNVYLLVFFSLMLAADTAFPLSKMYLGGATDIEHFKRSIYWIALLPAISATFVYFRKTSDSAET